MIDVKEVTKDYGICQGCKAQRESNASIFKVTIQSGNFGVEVRLCRKCLMDLKRQSEAVILNSL